MQNKYAAEFSRKYLLNKERNTSFKRLIWISPSATYRDEKQKLFVDNLRRDSDSSFGSELMCNKVEDFKSILFTFLKTKSDKEEKNIAILNKSKEDNLKKKVYIISDNRDEKSIFTLKEYLEKSEFLCSKIRIKKKIVKE